MCRQQKCWLDKNSSGSSSSSCSQAFQPHKLVLFLRGWSRMGAFGFPPISSTVMRKQTADQQKMEQKFMQWTTNWAPKKTEFDLCSLFLVGGGVSLRSTCVLRTSNSSQNPCLGFSELSATLLSSRTRFSMLAAFILVALKGCETREGNTMRPKRQRWTESIKCFSFVALRQSRSVWTCLRCTTMPLFSTMGFFL